MRPLAPALLLAALLLVPEIVGACPFCLSGTDEAREAYWDTTILLALLPVALVAGAALWLRHIARLAREDEARSESGQRLYQE
jgi:hypothetical protein